MAGVWPNQSTYFRKALCYSLVIAVVFLCWKKIEILRSWKITALLSFSSCRLGGDSSPLFWRLVCIWSTYRTAVVLVSLPKKNLATLTKWIKERRTFYPHTDHTKDILTFFLILEHLRTLIIVFLFGFLWTRNQLVCHRRLICSPAARQDGDTLSAWDNNISHGYEPHKADLSGKAETMRESVEISCHSILIPLPWMQSILYLIEFRSGCADRKGRTLAKQSPAGKPTSARPVPGSKCCRTGKLHWIPSFFS